MAQNFAIIYTLCSILVARFVVLIRTVRVFGVLVCYVLGLLVFGTLTKRPVYREGFGSHFSKVVTLYDEVLTVYLVLEALTTEQLPRSVRRRYPRHARHRRETHGVQGYKYQELKKGKIRLLVVKRSSWMLPSVIEMTLVHVSLGEILEGGTGVDFEAISYCYGSAERVDSILIDGGGFSVTEPAFNLILARRSMFRDRTLCIGAICINQSDLAEKERQIQMMRDIYSSAYRVVAVQESG
jgi:hypothetical protein